MSQIIPKRMTARKDQDFVVFLIGMRINKWWRIDQWLPVVRAMIRMMKEIHQKPETGFLGYEQWNGRTTMMMQYWESFEKLDAYAKDRTGEHFPAWVDFYKRVKDSAAVGIWHETYKISAGNYECVYFNMPKFGLGKIGNLIEAQGKMNTAKERMRNDV